MGAERDAPLPDQDLASLAAISYRALLRRSLADLAGLVSDVGDLYSLDLDALSSLERLAELSAQNILDNLETSRERPFDRVLFALGILHVGTTVARRNAARGGSGVQVTSVCQ